jgi:hypothetical protein
MERLHLSAVAEAVGRSGIRIFKFGILEHCSNGLLKMVRWSREYWGVCFSHYFMTPTLHQLITERRFIMKRQVKFFRVAALVAFVAAGIDEALVLLYKQKKPKPP